MQAWRLPLKWLPLWGSRNVNKKKRIASSPAAWRHGPTCQSHQLCQCQVSARLACLLLLPQPLLLSLQSPPLVMLLQLLLLSPHPPPPVVLARRAQTLLQPCVQAPSAHEQLTVAARWGWGVCKGRTSGREGRSESSYPLRQRFVPHRSSNPASRHGGAKARRPSGSRSILRCRCSAASELACTL